ncbi:MAG: hypothetical protein K6F23_09530 [Solobacterium sp.]|nr:hypothetical protein [Solobacterium sp.]
MVTVNPDYNEKLMAVNVGGTENIIAAMKYDVHTSFELPYLMAIAGGSALIHKRYE